MRVLDKIESVLRFDRFATASDVVRAQMSYLAAITVVLIQSLNIGLMFWSYGRWTHDHWVAVFTIVYMSVVLITLRNTTNFKIITALFLVLVFSGVGASAMENHTGINTALAAMIPISIMIAGLMSGWKSSVFVGVVAVVFVWCLYAWSQGVPDDSLYLTDFYQDKTFHRAAQTTLACVVMTVLTAKFSHIIHGLFSQLEKSVKKARDSELSKAAFMANMSHEIRTPLNGVIGMSGLLLETDLDEKQHRYANIVNECSRNLIQVINDVLDLSKMDAKKLVLHPDWVDIRRIIDSLVALHLPRCSEKGIRLKYFVAKAVPEEFYVDETRLRQVINNFLSNAVKFTTEGRVALVVGGQQAEDGSFKLVVSVQDSGIGIPPEQIPLVFQRFSQVDNSLSRSQEGTGLGLPICQEIITLMGGRISVDSQPNRGSTFSFILPLASRSDENRPANSGLPDDFDRPAKLAG